MSLNISKKKIKSVVSSLERMERLIPFAYQVI